jgi:peptidoglycan-associated lipoprotein
MKFTIKLLSVISVMFLLAACETAPGAGGSADGRGGLGSNPNATPGSQDDLVSNVGDRVFFALDSSVISSEAQGTLERQAAWLKQYTNLAVTVEGHCDERGTREYNLALGERRAAAAKNYLVSLGVDASRISTISYGKERPAIIGSDESAWGQNRRAVTIVSAQ